MHAAVASTPNCIERVAFVMSDLLPFDIGRTLEVQAKSCAVGARQSQLTVVLTEVAGADGGDVPLVERVLGPQREAPFGVIDGTADSHLGIEQPETGNQCQGGVITVAVKPR